jgi:hypothetical protein
VDQVLGSVTLFPLEQGPAYHQLSNSPYAYLYHSMHVYCKQYILYIVAK